MDIKNKICKNENCQLTFSPFKTTDNVCSIGCAIELKKQKEKAKESRGKQSKTTERKLLLETARITFNKFIRMRDKKKPCICCGKKLGNDYEAGHFFSGGGHASVLFDEDNVHAQRKNCNQGHRIGMLEEYATGLEKRIGEIEFEVLRAKAYEQKAWDVEELKAIIKEYKDKTRQLQLNQNS